MEGHSSLNLHSPELFELCQREDCVGEETIFDKFLNSMLEEHLRNVSEIRNLINPSLEMTKAAFNSNVSQRGVSKRRNINS